MGCASSSPINDGVSSDESSRTKDFFDSYILGPKLGQGSFAQVRVATATRSSKNKVAVKILDLRDAGEVDISSSKKRRIANREVLVWSSLKPHPNIVQLYDVSFVDTACFLAMEKCGSSLRRHLMSMPEYNEHTIKSIFLQMLNGISHLHQGDVVHRDIKPDNFLVSGGSVVKLCDFGLSLMIPRAGKLQGVAGTAPFTCPEMLECMGYDAKADIWSFGVLAYTLLYGAYPFMPQSFEGMSEEAMHRAIVRGNVPKFASVRKNDTTRSKEVVLFLQELLDRDPQLRPSAKNASKHKFLKMTKDDHDEQELLSLRHLLHPCTKIGAFEIAILWEKNGFDDLIENLYHKKYGRPFQESGSQTSTADTSGMRASEKSTKDETASNATTESTDVGSSKRFESMNNSDHRQSETNSLSLGHGKRNKFSL